MTLTEKDPTPEPRTVEVTDEEYEIIMRLRAKQVTDTAFEATVRKVVREELMNMFTVEIKDDPTHRRFIFPTR